MSTPEIPTHRWYMTDAPIAERYMLATPEGALCMCTRPWSPQGVAHFTPELSPSDTPYYWVETSPEDVPPRVLDFAARYLGL
jgi:hypothetical protein